MTFDPPFDESSAERVHSAVASLLNDAVEFTSTLVRERSVQGEEADAQHLVATKLRELGLDVRLLEATSVPGIEDHPEFVETSDSYDGRPNVVATSTGAGDGRSLLLNGHIDIVPEGDPEQWSFDPFGGAVVNGTIRGRGASDMKGGVAAILFAIEALQRAGIELNGDLTVQSVIEEEAGGYGGSLVTALDGCDADAVVIPEPTDFDLWIANDGVSYFRVTVEGRGAHAAHTDEGVNAISKLYPIYQSLQNLHDHRKKTVHDDLFEREYEHTVSLNLGTLRAGEWPSSVPDEAVLEGRISHAPSETRKGIRATVEETVREATAGDPWFSDHSPTVEWFGWRGSSASISPDEPIVQTVQNVSSASLGVDAIAKGFPGGIDTRFFVNYADTPALCFGPGAHNIHGTDEFLPVEELEQAITGLALIAMAWCGYDLGDESTPSAPDGALEERV